MKRASKLEAIREYERMLAELMRDLQNEAGIEAAYTRARIRAIRDQLILVR